MKVLVAGDFCDSLRVSNVIADKSYETLFGYIKDIITKVDYSILNFEFPIVKSVGNPIIKCGPNLKGQPEAIDAIQYAGFSCCTLANNHILDQGEECCLETIQLLSHANIDTVGAGRNLFEAEDILLKNINNELIAVINCCESEFSIADEYTAGANPLNPIRQYQKIKEAKQIADYVIVIVHGGHEHYQLPTLRMQETYRFFVDVGADAVINHHQHCYSGYEVYKNKPIFYGLGNLLFDHTSKHSGIWTEGYLVVIDFKKDNISFDIIPYKQCLEELVGVRGLRIDEEESFKKSIEKLNATIACRPELSRCLDEYYRQSAKEELLMMEPYTDTIFYQLFKRGLLPKFLKGEKKMKIENHIICESHREKLVYALKQSR